MHRDFYRAQLPAFEGQDKNNFESRTNLTAGGIIAQRQYGATWADTDAVSRTETRRNGSLFRSGLDFDLDGGVS